MRYALGTVQFGMRYGIANDDQETSIDEVCSILDLCKKSKIDTLDTAIGYGSSQTKLGIASVEGFKVITKIPSIKKNEIDVENWIKKNLEDSLNKLKLDTVHGLLLHNPSDLLSSNSTILIRTLNKLKEEGLTKNIGCSIYNPKDLIYITDVLDVDIIQAPFNIFDRRLIESNWLAKLTKKNIKVHIRSCFLQGLLLIPKADLPSKFNQFKELFDNWYQFLSENQISQISACLSFVNAFHDINRILVGVQNTNQLQEIINTKIHKINLRDTKFISSKNLDLIDPSRW